MIDLEELKRWATDGLDYEDTEIGKDHKGYGGHYFAGVLAIVAKLEALERGEFICKSCGHRKDADASKIDPPF